MSIFISHGAPDLMIRKIEAYHFMKTWNIFHSNNIDAIIIISAHWISDTFRITAHPTPPTIYDFEGFPPELYKTKYLAMGAPKLAYQISSFLNDNNLKSSIDTQRGLDHGVWSPLSIITPKPTVPIIQISLDRSLDETLHTILGEKLVEWNPNLLIIGSGSITHNLRLAFQRLPYVPEEVLQFSDWFAQMVRKNDKIFIRLENISPLCHL